MRAALRAGGVSTIALPVLKVSPKITQKNMPRTIVVRVDENKLYLYDGFDVIRTWSVATAMPGWTTPQGDWNLYRKAVNPTWYNPALDSWGADLPAVVPGGPTAPMGTRALYITAPGLIRIHGTPADSSIGTYASHGCIRMHNYEIEHLYPMVDVGTRVIVVGHAPRRRRRGRHAGLGQRLSAAFGLVTLSRLNHCREPCPRRRVSHVPRSDAMGNRSATAGYICVPGASRPQASVTAEMLGDHTRVI